MLISTIAMSTCLALTPLTTDEDCGFCSPLFSLNAKRKKHALFNESMCTQIHKGKNAFSTALVHFIIVS